MKINNKTNEKNKKSKYEYLKKARTLINLRTIVAINCTNIVQNYTNLRKIYLRRCTAQGPIWLVCSWDKGDNLRTILNRNQTRSL